MEAICKHTRTEVLARRDGVDYVRCLDCDKICEAEDLESVPVFEDDEEPLNGKPPQPNVLKTRTGFKQSRK